MINTLAGRLGHALEGVTQGYVHLNAALVVAADQVSAKITRALDQVAPRRARPTSPRKFVGTVELAA